VCKQVLAARRRHSFAPSPNIRVALRRCTSPADSLVFGSPTAECKREQQPTTISGVLSLTVRTEVSGALVDLVPHEFFSTAGAVALRVTVR
jgi:hypothetical protein